MNNYIKTLVIISLGFVSIFPHISVAGLTFSKLPEFEEDVPTSDEIPGMGEVPTEVFVEILDYLNHPKDQASCNEVCKAWRELGVATFGRKLAKNKKLFDIKVAEIHSETSPEGIRQRLDETWEIISFELSKDCSLKEEVARKKFLHAYESKVLSVLMAAINKSDEIYKKTPSDKPTIFSVDPKNTDYIKTFQAIKDLVARLYGLTSTGKKLDQEIVSTIKRNYKFARAFDNMNSGSNWCFLYDSCILF
jgi:hypothetical protein